MSRRSRTLFFTKVTLHVSLHVWLHHGTGTEGTPWPQQATDEVRHGRWVFVSSRWTAVRTLVEANPNFGVCFFLAVARALLGGEELARLFLGRAWSFPLVVLA